MLTERKNALDSLSFTTRLKYIFSTMASYNFSQVRGRKTFPSSGQIQFVLFMQTGLRGFCLAPTRKKFLFSRTSSDRSSSPPPRQTDEMIWNGLPHFLIWFHRDFCRRGFQLSILSCVALLEADVFFQQKAFDYNQSCCEKRCQKQSLSDNCCKLGIHYTWALF